jgi:SRSO17 transposase
VTTRLYLPKDEWAHDPVRRQRAHIPDTIQFQTKAEIALDLLDQARAWGVRHRCVVSDADYGDNPRFLDGLEERREPYVAAVRSDFQVALSRHESAPPQRADAALDAQPRRRWHTVRWKEGSRGWLKARFVAVRCWRVDGAGRRCIGWLIGQRPVPGEAGEAKHFWSGFPAHTTLERIVEYTHRRHWVEQYHEEAKGELGWDQYQGRLWTGFHRNAVLVMLSFSFLAWMEWRKRQRQRLPGRPRRVFSPAAGSATEFARFDP